MVAFDEKLSFILQLDANGAIRGFGQLRATAARDLGEVDNRLDRIGGRMQAVGAGALAFAGVAGRALYGFARASEEANLSQLQLQNTLDNQPQLAGETADAFNDLADAIQDKTAADGDQVVSAMAMLGTFRLTGDEIRNVTPLVVDYARKFSVDLKDAAVQVGKALDGNSGALRRNGVSIDEALFATDRYAAVTEALREQVGGFAEEEGATFAGQMERLKNNLGDVAEGIGTGVVGAVNGLVEPLGNLADRFSELDPATQAVIGQTLTYGTALVGLVGAASFTAGSLIRMTERFSQVGGAISDFVSTAGGVGPALRKMIGPAGLAVAAVGTVAAVLYRNAQRAEEAERRMESYAEAMRSAGDDAEGAASAFGQVVIGNEKLAETLAITGFTVDEVASAFAEGGGAAAEMNSAVLAAGEAAGLSGDDLLRLAVTLAQNADAAAAAATHNKNLATAEAEVNETLDETPRAVGRASAAYDAFIRKQGELEGAIEDVIDAQRELFSGRRSERRALLDLHDAQDRLTEVNADGEATDRDRERALLDLQDAQEQYGEAVRERAEQEEIANGNVATAAEVAARRQIEALLQVAAALAPGSPTRVYLEEYIRLLDEAARPRQAQLTIRLRQVADDVGAHPGMMSPEGPSRAPRVVAGDDVRQKSVTVNAYGVGTAEVSQQIARDLTWEIN